MITKYMILPILMTICWIRIATSAPFLPASIVSSLPSNNRGFASIIVPTEEVAQNPRSFRSTGTSSSSRSTTYEYNEIDTLSRIDISTPVLLTDMGIRAYMMVMDKFGTMTRVPCDKIYSKYFPPGKLGLGGLLTDNKHPYSKRQEPLMKSKAIRTIGTVEVITTDIPIYDSDSTAGENNSQNIINDTRIYSPSVVQSEPDSKKDSHEPPPIKPIEDNLQKSDTSGVDISTINQSGIEVRKERSNDIIGETPSLDPLRSEPHLAQKDPETSVKTETLGPEKPALASRLNESKAGQGDSQNIIKNDEISSPNAVHSEPDLKNKSHEPPIKPIENDVKKLDTPDVGIIAANVNGIEVRKERSDNIIGETSSLDPLRFEPRLAQKDPETSVTTKTLGPETPALVSHLSESKAGEVDSKNIIDNAEISPPNTVQSELDLKKESHKPLIKPTEHDLKKLGTHDVGFNGTNPNGTEIRKEHSNDITGATSSPDPDRSEHDPTKENPKTPFITPFKWDIYNFRTPRYYFRDKYIDKEKKTENEDIKQDDESMIKTQDDENESKIQNDGSGPKPRNVENGPEVKDDHLKMSS